MQKGLRTSPIGGAVAFNQHAGRARTWDRGSAQIDAIEDRSLGVHVASTRQEVGNNPRRKAKGSSQGHHGTAQVCYFNVAKRERDTTNDEAGDREHPSNNSLESNWTASSSATS